MGGREGVKELSCFLQLKGSLKGKKLDIYKVVLALWVYDGLSFEDKEVFIAHMVPSIGLWIQKSGTWKFDYCHTNTLFKYTYFPFIFP